MKIILKKYFTLLFLIIVAFVLFANSIHNFTLTIIFKPLIVISLLVYLFVADGHKEKSVIFAISGLLLSLAGDILLIFQEQNSLFFIGGLVSFLLAHLSYIFYYVRSSDSFDEKKLKNKPVFILLLVLYGILLYAILYVNLGGLKVPVLAYTVVLISMNIFAMNRYGKVNHESFKLIMIGALCFVLSDSLLAINKFLLPIPLAGGWIMITYSAAQYFITQGVLSKK